MQSLSAQAKYSTYPSDTCSSLYRQPYLSVMLNINSVGLVISKLLIPVKAPILILYHALPMDDLLQSGSPYRATRTRFSDPTSFVVLAHVLAKTLVSLIMAGLGYGSWKM